MRLIVMRADLIIQAGQEDLWEALYAPWRKAIASVSG
jgi:hypothetical protein